MKEMSAVPSLETEIASSLVLIEIFLEIKRSKPRKQTSNDDLFGKIHDRRIHLLENQEIPTLGPKF